MKTTEPRILLIEDDLDVQMALIRMLKTHFLFKAVGDVASAITELKSNATKYDMILTDVQLPGTSGLKLPTILRENGFDLPVIVMTAYGSLESAVSAMKDGASDYILKPINTDALKHSIDRILRIRSLETENTILRQEAKRAWSIDNIIGKSAPVRAVLDIARRVAPTQANILIMGETGTGKEVFARAIHNLSTRSVQPFVAINCSAIPAGLLESELFGHAKGAFTGAHQNKKGLFEEARGGTIFLDEIGDMEILLQAKLLRVIQERKIKPVGSNVEVDIDIRIISATHKDLKAAIKDNLFREDLFYRLCVIPIELPALRQRKEDIPLLTDYFFRKYVTVHGLKVRGFTPQALEALVNYPWDGNVRELENFVERSALLCTEEWISEKHLHFMNAPQSSSQFLDDRFSENLNLREVEKRYINMILRRTGMRKEKAAQILGIDRKTLYRKEREFGLTKNVPDAGVPEEAFSGSEQA